MSFLGEEHMGVGALYAAQQTGLICHHRSGTAVCSTEQQLHNGSSVRTTGEANAGSDRKRVFKASFWASAHAAA